MAVFSGLVIRLLVNMALMGTLSEDQVSPTTSHVTVALSGLPFFPLPS